MNAQQSDFERALALEPALVPIDRTVRLLCELVRPSDHLCNGCIWSAIVKPLARPLVGWGRGYPPEQADAKNSEGFCVNLAELLNGDIPLPERVPATTEDEEWLRTDEAWNAVTDEWVRLLYAADPGNGHGYGRALKKVPS